MPLQSDGSSQSGRSEPNFLQAKPSVIFVVPCFNEQDVIPSSHPQLRAQIEQLSSLGLCDENGSGILYVDDGSTDSTWEIIERLCANDAAVLAVRLSRNKGHQAALLAGVEAGAQCADVVISIDADLQDDIIASIDMLRMYSQGYEIVYGVRSSRTTDSLSKRTFANLFYTVMLMLGVDIVPGHADYRLMSSRAVAELLRYEERSLFLRGIIPQLGFKTSAVYYARKHRPAGITKYPFRKSLSLAIDGILSFSYKPLRIIAYSGLVLGLFSLIGVGRIIYAAQSGSTLPGWASIVVAIGFLGAIQLFCLGILGEYVARIYREVKRRPRYHVQASLGFQPPSQP
jgi:glycosyltransferase involved in cell wall biosynthesis